MSDFETKNRNYFGGFYHIKYWHTTKEGQMAHRVAQNGSGVVLDCMDS